MNFVFKRVLLFGAINFCLVGNVGNMLAHVAMTATLLAKDWLTSHVVNAVTGFMAGSHATHATITLTEVTVVF